MKKLLFALFLCFPVMAYAQDPLLQTMQNEVKTNFRALKKQKSSVYYLSYLAEETVSLSFSAGYDGMQNTSAQKNMTVDVMARAGSAALDNTHEIKGEYVYSRKIKSYPMPLNGQGPAVKNALRRGTETAAKKAQEEFLKVKANDSLRAESEDRSPDFEKVQAPARYYQKAAPSAINAGETGAFVKELSTLAKGLDYVFDSYVSVSVDTANRYFVDSEGASIVKGRTLVTLFYEFNSKAEDGDFLSVYNSYHGFSVEELPSKEQITADIKESLRKLKELQKAPLAEPYTGPVLLLNRASGVFFHEVLGHRVEGNRQKKESYGQTFKKQIGQQVVAPFISVYDDPALKYFNGTALRGHYEYDDEGIKAQKASIVENGVFKGFLMNRSPIENFPFSNGHGRKQMGRESVARMGNTMIEAHETMPFSELKELLRQTAKEQGKEYGLMIEDITGGETNTTRYDAQTFKVNPTITYKVFADGRPDQMIRGVVLSGTPLTSFKKIIAAGDDTDIFNGTCGAESGSVPVSAVSPSILLSEIEMEKGQKSSLKKPVLKPPYSLPGVIK